MFNKEYTPLNNISVSKSAILNNLDVLSAINPGVKVLPVLKSNAYGHGIREIYSILKDLNLEYICVDSLYEAYEIYKLNPKQRVLITGFVSSENLAIKNLPFDYAIWSFEQLLEISQVQKDARFHLFIDTGMCREGVQIKDLEEFCNKVPSDLSERIVGIMSHFASADDQADPQTDVQIEEFNKGLKIAQKYFKYIEYRHISATAGVLRDKNLNVNYARSGIGLYGFGLSESHPLKKGVLKPALRLTSKLVQIKTIAEGSLVGYNGTFKAEREIKIGILPIGYNDGVDRRLSNTGFVKIRGKYFRIIGRVSMNITTIDLTEVDDISVEDEVIIYSDQIEDRNSIDNVASICKTIPYEILVHLHSSIRRNVVDS